LVGEVHGAILFFDDGACWDCDGSRDGDGRGDCTKPAAAAPPHKVDVAQMVACKYDVPTFNDYAMALGASGEGAAALGLTRIEDTPNPFMHEYQLAAPIDVLGWRTQRVALASGALLAVLDQVKPQDVAQRLGIEEALRDDDFKYMAMRVAHHTQEKVSSSTLNTVISHEVSTVITHPGQVLVGCSYRVNTY